MHYLCSVLNSTLGYFEPEFDRIVLHYPVEYASSSPIALRIHEQAHADLVHGSTWGLLEKVFLRLLRKRESDDVIGNQMRSLLSESYRLSCTLHEGIATYLGHQAERVLKGSDSEAVHPRTQLPDEYVRALTVVEELCSAVPVGKPEDLHLQYLTLIALGRTALEVPHLDSADANTFQGFDQIIPFLLRHPPDDRFAQIISSYAKENAFPCLVESVRNVLCSIYTVGGASWFEDLALRLDALAEKEKTSLDQQTAVEIHKIISRNLSHLGRLPPRAALGDRIDRFFSFLRSRFPEAGIDYVPMRSRKADETTVSFLPPDNHSSSQGTADHRGISYGILTRKEVARKLSLLSFNQAMSPSRSLPVLLQNRILYNPLDVPIQLTDVSIPPRNCLVSFSTYLTEMVGEGPALREQLGGNYATIVSVEELSEIIEAMDPSTVRCHTAWETYMALQESGIELASWPGRVFIDFETSSLRAYGMAIETFSKQRKLMVTARESFREGIVILTACRDSGCPVLWKTAVEEEAVKLYQQLVSNGQVGVFSDKSKADPETRDYLADVSICIDWHFLDVAGTLPYRA